MTYITEQTSLELRQHMKRITATDGWHEPLASRLWKEVQELDTRIAELEALRDVVGKQRQRMVVQIDGLETRSWRLGVHCNQMLLAWKGICDTNCWDWKHMSQFEKAAEFLE